MLKRLSFLALLCFYFAVLSAAKPFATKEPKYAVAKHREIIITSSGTIICPGKSVTLTTDFGGPYQWLKDGVAIENATTKTHIANQAGTYKLSAGLGNNLPPEESNEIIITAATNPTASFTSTANGSQCSNEEISFNSSASTGNGLSYFWDFGDVNSGSENTSTEANPKHVFIGDKGGANNTFTVKLTVTSSEGCISSTFSANVVTKQIPDVSLADVDSFFPFSNCHKNPTVANPNYTIKLNNTSSSSSIISTYTIDWKDGTIQTGLRSSSFPVSHTYTRLGAFEMVVTAFGANGCSNSKTYTIANQSNPAGGLGTLGNTAGLCAPAEVPFVISNWQNNSPGTTYFLDFGDGKSVTLSHPLNSTNQDYTVYHTYETSSCPATSFIAKLFVRNACAETPYTAGNIQIWIRPVADFKPNPSTICAGKSVSFSNLTKKGSYGNNCTDQTVYTWDFGDPTSSSNTSASENASHTYTTAGSYTVTLTATNPCGTTTKTQVICVNPLPTSSFTLDQSIGCAPFTVKTTNTSIAPTCGENTYTWSVSYTSSPTECSPVATMPILVSGTLTSANPEFKFERAGTYTISLVTKNSDGTCTSATAVKTINVKAKPVVTLANIGNICEGLSISPTANVLNCYSSTTETYLWEFPGSNTPTSTLKIPGNIIYSTAGSHSFTLKVTNECGVTTATSNTFTVNEAPVTTGIPDKTICNNSSVAAINFADFTTGTGSKTYTWTNDKSGIGLALSGSGSIINSFTAVNNTAAPVVATITVTPTIGSCKGLPFSFKITINPSTPTASAGPQQILCTTTSTTLAGNNPGSLHSGKWTVIQGTGAVFADDTKYNTSVTGMQVGQSYTFRWTISGLGSCAATFSDVVVNVIQPPIANTINDIVLCRGAVNPVLNFTASPAGASFSWTNSNTAIGLFSSGNGSLPSFTATNNGTVPIEAIITVTPKNGNCNGATTSFKITVNPSAPTANAGPRQTLCAANSTTLAGNDPGSLNSGKWTLLEGTGAVITDDTKYNTTVSGLQAGQSYTFRWTVSGIGSCAATFSDVVVDVLQTPTVNAVSDLVLCKGVAAPVLNFSGSPTGVTYSWTNSNTAIGLSASGNGSLPGFTTTNNGTVPIEAIITVTPKNGICSGSTISFKITVNPSTPTANAGPRQTLCAATSTTLAGNDPGSLNSGKWTVVSGTGTAFADDTKYNTSVTGLQAGLRYTFKWTINGSGSCAATSSDVIIDVLQTPTVNAVSDLVLCKGAIAPVVNFSGSPAGVTYSWTNSNPAIGLASSGTGNLPSFTAANNSTVPIEATITVTPKNGICNGSPINFKITINPSTPIATAGSKQTLCATTTTQLQGNNPGNLHSGKWTVGPATGVVFDDDTKYNANVSGLQVGQSYTFTWTINGLGTCTATNASVVIEILAKPVVNAVNNVVVCKGAQAPQISFSGTPANVTYSWTNSNTSIGLASVGNGNLPSFNAINNGIAPISSTITVTPRVGNCDGDPITFTITVNPSAEIATVGRDQDLCEVTSTILTGNDPKNSTGKWTIVSGTGITFVDDTKYNTELTGLQNGQTYVVKWTIDGFNPCPSSAVNLRITVAPKTNGGSTAGAQSYCGITTAGNISLTGHVGNVKGWQQSIDGLSWTDISPVNTTATLSYNSLTITMHYRAKVQSGNCDLEYSTPTKITVNPIPAKPSTTLSITYCLGETSTQLNAIGNNLKWYSSLPLNAPSLVAPTPSTAVAGTFNFYVTQTIDGCESPYELIKVTVIPSITTNNISADQTICLGASPNALISSNGMPNGGTGTYQYQWQESADGTTFTDINNATSANYQPPALQVDNYYKRIVKSGNCSSESNIIKIAVQGSLSNYQLSATQTICAGSTPAKLIGEIPSGGSGTYIYTWEKSTTSATAGFTEITGENGADYQSGPLTQTTFFRRKVKSGSCEIMSDAIAIKVNPIPTMVTVAAQLYCKGAPVAAVIFSTNQDATKVTYAWANDNINIGLGATGTGNLPTFNAQNSTNAPLEANITVTPTYTDEGKACEGSAMGFKIIVLPTVTTSVIADLTVCTTTNVPIVNLSSDAANFVGSTISYKWAVTGAAIGLINGSGTQIPQFTAINNGTAAAISNITVTPIYSFKNVLCEGIPTVYHITVNPAPKVNFSIADQTICNNTSSTEITLTSTTTDATISWTAQPIAGMTGLVTSGTNKIPAQTLINTTNQPITVVYRAVATTTGSAQCQGTIATYQITVNPSTNVSASALTKTICSNAKTGISLTSTTPGTVFTWSISNNSNITGASSGTGNLIDQTLINNANLPQVLTYTVVPKFTNNNQICEGDPILIAITVNPTPKVAYSSADLVICSGTTTPLVNLTSATPNAIITYTSVVPAGITGATSISGNTTIAAQILHNSANVPLTISYTAIAKTDDASACTGIPFQFTITVNPVAKVTNVPVVQNICSGASSTAVALTSNVNPTSFRWTASSSSPNLIGFIASGTGNIPAQNLLNSGTTVEKVSYVVTPTANNCEGTPITYVINVSPSPTFTGDLANRSVCSKTTFNYVPTSSTTGVTFKWTRAAVTGIDNPAATGTGIDAAGAINEVLNNYTLNTIDVTYVYEMSINGCSTGIKYPLKVTVKPAPTASFGPVSQNGCAPFLLTVKNLNSRTANSTYTVNFGDGSPLEVFTDERDITHTYENTSTLTKTFTMHITTKNECGVANSIGYVILVQPQSVYSKLVLQGTDRYGCAPFLVDFTKLNQSSGANLYTWDFGDGSPKQETKSLNEKITHTYVNPGDYIVKLTATNGCSTVTTDQLITVYGTVTASFDVNKVQNCVGEEFKFTNTSDPQLTSLWHFGDGNTSSDISPAYAFKTPGLKTITLTVTKTYPTGGSCTATITRTVNVAPLPVSSFTSNAGQLNCGPFNLIVNTADPNASNIEWDFGDPGSEGNVKGGLSSTHIYTKAGTYTVTAKAYNLSGCTTTSTQTVKVTETPVAAFTFPDHNICGTSATVLFTNTATYGGTDLVSYKWYINGTFVSDVKNLNHQFSVPTSAAMPYVYLIKLEAINILGCLSTVEQNLQFNPFPKASFTLDKNLDCAPFKPVVVNNSTYGDLYNWYIDGELASQEKTPTLIFDQSNKKYKLKLVVTNQWGCTQSIEEKEVTTRPTPTADFSLKKDFSCDGTLALEITNASTGATTYSWDYGDGTALDPRQNPSHTYVKAGSYILTLTVSNGFCTDVKIHNINVSDAPKSAFLTDVKSGCNKITVSFSNLSVNATEYEWDFGAMGKSGLKNPVQDFVFSDKPYTVRLKVKNAVGCWDESVDYITVYPPPVVNIVISPNKIIKIPDYTFKFETNTVEQIISYDWDFGDGKKDDKANVTHTYTSPGTYKIKLSVVSIAGCKNEIYDELTILGVPGHLFIPNAFEPGSSKLDLQVFKVNGVGMSAYSLKVFNKWGQLLWQTDKLDSKGAPLESWDGKLNGVLQPQGAYYWRADAKFINGNEWKGMKYEGSAQLKTGVIHLIR